MKLSKLAKTLAVATFATAIAIPSFSSATAAAPSIFSTAKSASEAGGMAALRSQCKKEGQLNIIATPVDWANYGEIIDGFKAKYGVKIDSNNPDGSSQDEIDAANSLKGTMRSPDVFDVGTAVGYKYIDTHYAQIGRAHV